MANATSTTEARTAVYSHREAKALAKNLDWLALIALFTIIWAAYHVHAMLTIGDWDFWVDWKDRRMWPTVYPILMITFPAAAQAFMWDHLRMPFAATFVALGVFLGEWINRYFNFWGWTYFPIAHVAPTLILPMALFLDCMLLVTKRYLLTAIFGGLGFSLLMYPSNWPVIAQFHQPVNNNGVMMSIADVIGYEYVRSQTPDYLRMVERGTMRTFGADVVPVSAFFAGFVCILQYLLWIAIGKWFSTIRFIGRI